MRPFAYVRRRRRRCRRGRTAAGRPVHRRRYHPRGSHAPRRDAASRPWSTSPVCRLAAIEPHDGGVRIGALARNTDVAYHPLVASALPRPRRGAALGRVAAAPQHGDGRRQPPPAHALLVLSRPGVALQQARSPARGARRSGATRACTRSSARASSASRRTRRTCASRSRRSTRWFRSAADGTRARDPVWRFSHAARRPPRGRERACAGRARSPTSSCPASPFARHVALRQGARPRVVRVRAGVGGRRRSTSRTASSATPASRSVASPPSRGGSAARAGARRAGRRRTTSFRAAGSRDRRSEADARQRLQDRARASARSCERSSSRGGYRERRVPLIWTSRHRPRRRPHEGDRPRDLRGRGGRRQRRPRRDRREHDRQGDRSRRSIPAAAERAWRRAGAHAPQRAASSPVTPRSRAHRPGLPGPAGRQGTLPRSADRARRRGHARARAARGELVSGGTTGRARRGDRRSPGRGVSACERWARPRRRFDARRRRRRVRLGHGPDRCDVHDAGRDTTTRWSRTPRSRCGRAATTLTLYDATQAIFGVRKKLAAVFGLSPDNVRVIGNYVRRRLRLQGVAVVARACSPRWPRRSTSRAVKLVVTRPQMFGVRRAPPEDRSRSSTSARSQAASSSRSGTTSCRRRRASTSSSSRAPS